jgi:hypothetical protein
MSAFSELAASPRLPRTLALFNLLPAFVLGAGCWALPARYWALDVPVVILVAVLLASSAFGLAKPVRALPVLRWAALLLLTLGALLFAAFTLSLAFLAGVHGAFGNFGAILMALVLLLLAPYTIGYPLFELWLLSLRERGSGDARVAPSTEEDPAA